MSTARLAVLKAVFVDGSAPVVSRPAVQPLELPQFTAGHIWIECVNSDGEPHSLTYDTVLLGVRRYPTDALPAISVQASNMDTDPDGEPADNWARAELVPGHWTDVDPKMYGYDVAALVGGDPDDRMVVVPHSNWKATPADAHPGDDIQVPDTQEPLAQGPQGEQGETGPQGAQGEPGPEELWMGEERATGVVTVAGGIGQTAEVAGIDSPFTLGTSGLNGAVSVEYFAVCANSFGSTGKVMRRARVYRVADGVANVDATHSVFSTSVNMASVAVDVDAGTGRFSMVATNEGALPIRVQGWMVLTWLPYAAS